VQNRRKHSQARPLALEGFTIKSVVDWQSFDVTLQNPSQFRHLQERALETWGKVHFKEVPGTESRTWSFRVQNPIGPDQFMRDVQSIRDHDDPVITEQDVRITGVEIAIDAYHPTSDRPALALAVHHFMRHQAHPPAGLPRITGPGLCSVPVSPRVALQALVQGSITINAGAVGADHTSRFYVKDYDTINGVPYAPLPPEQWRARFECTLRGNAVPFSTINGWRNYRLETLAKDRLALVLPNAPKSPLSAVMQDNQLQFGFKPDTATGRPDDRLKSWANTRRDTITNDKIRMALRALTKLQK
jgi:hypothetical protein